MARTKTKTEKELAVEYILNRHVAISEGRVSQRRDDMAETAKPTLPTGWAERVNPCPYCGSTDLYLNTIGFMHFIECNACGARSSHICGAERADGTKRVNVGDEVIENWNSVVRR